MDHLNDVKVFPYAFSRCLSILMAYIAYPSRTSIVTLRSGFIKLTVAALQLHSSIFWVCPSAVSLHTAATKFPARLIFRATGVVPFISAFVSGCTCAKLWILASFN